MNGYTSSLDFAYGPEFKMAPVDYSLDCSGRLCVLIDNRVMDKNMYHRLPEHRDWDSLIRQEFAVVGRVALTPGILDLVVVSELDGDLRSAFMHRSQLRDAPEKVRAFFYYCFERAPIITLQEDRNKRSTK